MSRFSLSFFHFRLFRRSKTLKNSVFLIFFHFFRRKNREIRLFGYICIRIYGDNRRGRQSPFLLSNMTLNEQITALVEEKIAGSDNFLVEVKVSPAKVVVLIDHPSGIKIEDCVSVSRFLQEKLDSTDVFERHELEVGSPGMEEPLKVLKQYHKRLGKNISVLTLDGVRRNGILKNATDDGIDIEETVIVKEGKKKEKQVQHNFIPFTNIKETKVIFSFNKII